MSNRRPLTTSHLQHFVMNAGLVGCLVFGGCSDDDAASTDEAVSETATKPSKAKSDESPKSDESKSDEAESDEAKSEAPDLYAVTTQRYSPGQNLAYVQLVSDINKTEVAIETTLEIPGYGLAVGPQPRGLTVCRERRGSDGHALFS